MCHTVIMRFSFGIKMKCCTDLSEFDNNTQSPYGFFFCVLPPPRGSGITPDNLCFAFQSLLILGVWGVPPAAGGKLSYSPFKSQDLLCLIIFTWILNLWLATPAW